MKTFKKKFLGTIISTALLIVLVAGTIVAVIASNNISSNSNVSVQYDSTITASVVANYWTEASGSKTNFITEQRISENTSGKVDDIVLQEGNEYVIFEYAFVNHMQNMCAYAKLLYEDTDIEDANSIVDYYYSTTEQSLSSIENVAYENSKGAIDFVDYDEVDGVTTTRNVYANNIYLAPNDTTYVYIKVEIDNIINDAEFSGTFTWKMQYDLFDFEFNGSTLTSYTGVYRDENSQGYAGHVVIPEYYINEDGERVEVTGIDSYVFYYMFGFSLYIPSSIVTTGISNDEIFNDCTLSSITIDSATIYSRLNYDNALGTYTIFGPQNFQGKEVLVLKSVVDTAPNNTYLNDTTYYTKTTRGDYYVYTRTGNDYEYDYSET